MAITPVITHKDGTGATVSTYAGIPLVFDACGPTPTTSTVWSWASGELDFVWTVDGGVPSSYTYGDSRISHATKFGPRCAFHFVTAGVYTVTCTITEPGTLAQEVATVTVTVNDWSGATDYYVDGGAASDGVGTSGDPFKYWDTALTAINAVSAGTLARLFCNRGSTVTQTSTIPEITRNNVYIGAYGSGVLPIVSTGASVALEADDQTVIVADSIDFRATTARAVVGTWAVGGLTRCRSEVGAEYAIRLDGASYDFVCSDCELVSSTYCYSGGGVAGSPANYRRRIIDGCTLSHSLSGPESLLRAYMPYGAVYGSALNSLKRTACRLMSEIAEDQAEMYVGYNTITCDEASGAGIQAFAANGGTHSNIVTECNKFVVPATNTEATVVLHSFDGNTPAVVTNFIAKNSKISGDHTGLRWLTKGGGGASWTNAVRFYNLTMEHDGTGELLNYSGAGDAEVKNCIYVEDPTEAGNYVFATGNLTLSNLDVEYNLFLWNGLFSDLSGDGGTGTGFALYPATNINGYSVDPLLDASLDITAGSPMIGAGDGTLAVVRDFYGNLREPGAIDIGAHQLTAYTEPVTNTFPTDTQGYGSRLPEALYDHLIGDTDLIAYLGNRIYPFAPDDQGDRAADTGASTPYLVITYVSDLPEYDMAGTAGVEHETVQLDVYADSSRIADRTADTLRARMIFRGEMGDPALTVRGVELLDDRASYESPVAGETVGLHRRMLEYRISYTQAVTSYQSASDLDDDNRMTGSDFPIAIYHHLTTDGEIQALLGGRVYPGVPDDERDRIADTGAADPYCVITYTSNVPEYDMSGTIGVEHRLVQLDVIAQSDVKALQATTAIRRRMLYRGATSDLGKAVLSCELQDERGGYEPPTAGQTTGHYRRTLEYAISYQTTAVEWQDS